MYYNLDNHEVWINFNHGIHIGVKGSSDIYLAEVYEFLPNDDTPYLLDTTNMLNDSAFDIPRNWYGKMMARVSVFDEETSSIILLAEEIYDDRGQDVLFELVSDDLDEVKNWLTYVYQYVEDTGCIPHIKTNFPEKLYFPIVNHKLYYRTYMISRYNQELYRWDEVFHNECEFGRFRKFWSGKQPRDVTKLKSEEVVRDILGFTEKEGVKLFLVK